MRRAEPSLVFAVVGQARADGTITPDEESRLLSNMLTYWALRGTLDLSNYCPPPSPSRTRLTPAIQHRLNPALERIAI
jgi:hypothetical protein